MTCPLDLSRKIIGLTTQAPSCENNNMHCPPMLHAQPSWSFTTLQTSQKCSSRKQANTNKHMNKQLGSKPNHCERTLLLLLSSAIANRHVWLQYCTVFGSCCTYAIKLAWTYIQMYGSITASQTWLNTWLTCLYAPRCSMWQSVYTFYDFMCSMAIPAPIMAITTCFGEPLPPRWLPKPQLLAPAPSADLGPWKHCPQSPPLHWSSGCLPQNGS